MIVTEKFYILLFISIFLHSTIVLSQQNKTKLKQLGVQESEDEIGINSEQRENYIKMEAANQKRKKVNKVKSGLGVAPSKDLPQKFEDNQFDLNKTWRQLGPLDPPVQLDFESDF